MNFSPLNIAIIVVGMVLIYAALKDVDPRVVVGNALKGKPTVAAPPSEGVAPPSAVQPPSIPNTSV